MKKQGLSILLIIMMLITPIASAFDHCAGMDMAAYLSESQNFSVSVSADDANHLEHQKMHKESQNIAADMGCESNGDCTFHVCGGYGITSTASSINTVSFSYYSIIEYALPYTTVLSPDLRPPIFIL